MVPSGLQAVGAYYLVPYVITNYHLVLITFLQHTDVYMPHFRNKVKEEGHFAGLTGLGWSIYCYVSPSSRVYMCS